METHEEDRIRIDIQSMWKEKIPCGRITVDDAITDGRRAQGAGYPITTPHSLDPLKGVGGDQLQPRVEDGGTHTEFVARVENLAGKNGKKKAVST